MVIIIIIKQNYYLFMDFESTFVKQYLVSFEVIY